MNALQKINSLLKTDENNGCNAEVDGDTLLIDCRKCPRPSEARSSECIRCIVTNVSLCGNAERIRLRTSKDTEISGPAAEILCDMAFVSRSARTSAGSFASRSCGSCGYSCDKIIDMAWSGFPEPYFDQARSKLMAFRPGERECELCLQKTYRSLDQAEQVFGGMRKKVSMEVSRSGGR